MQAAAAAAAAAAAHLDFTDLSQVNAHTGEQDGGGGGVKGNSVGGNATGKEQRKAHKKRTVKNTIHRTRSQFSLDLTGLPDDLTVSLAETSPRELKLRSRTVVDSRIYRDENAQRCERWLEGVRASEPLDDVVFAQGSGVEVSIPEEGYLDYQGCGGELGYNGSSRQLDCPTTSASECGAGTPPATRVRFTRGSYKTKPDRVQTIHIFPSDQKTAASKDDESGLTDRLTALSSSLLAGSDDAVVSLATGIKRDEIKLITDVRENDL